MLVAAPARRSTHWFKVPWIRALLGREEWAARARAFVTCAPLTEAWLGCLSTVRPPLDRIAGTGPASFSTENKDYAGGVECEGARHTLIISAYFSQNTFKLEGALSTWLSTERACLELAGAAIELWTVFRIATSEID